MGVGKKNGGEEQLTQTLAFLKLAGRGTASLPQNLPLLLAGGGGPRSPKLASPRSRGEGDHEVVEGGRSKRSMPAKRA